MSGTTTKWLGLNDVLAALRTGDMLTVWHLDPLGYSMQQPLAGAAERAKLSALRDDYKGDGSLHWIWRQLF